jgi:hypothetical protein
MYCLMYLSPPTAPLQYGDDPADLEVEAGTRRLNFSFERFAAALPSLRACSNFPELQELVKSLRDEGGLARLATAGSAGAGGNGTAAGVTAAAAAEEEEEEEEEGGEQSGPAGLEALPEGQEEEGAEEAEEEEEQEEEEEEEEEEEAEKVQRAPAAAEGAAGGTSARLQPPGGGTGRGRGVALTGAKGRSSLAGVYGKGPWVAQASVWRSKVRPGPQPATSGKQLNLLLLPLNGMLLLHTVGLPGAAQGPQAPERLPACLPPCPPAQMVISITHPAAHPHTLFPPAD